MALLCALRVSARAFSFQDKRLKGLTLQAGGEHHRRQMKRELIGVVAIPAESGTVTALRRERKMLASNDFRMSEHPIVGIYMCVFVHEPLAVY
jgi:hypothetical protein